MAREINAVKLFPEHHDPAEWEKEYSGWLVSYSDNSVYIDLGGDCSFIFTREQVQELKAFLSSDLSKTILKGRRRIHDYWIHVEKLEEGIEFYTATDDDPDYFMTLTYSQVVFLTEFAETPPRPEYDPSKRRTPKWVRDALRKNTDSWWLSKGLKSNPDADRFLTDKRFRATKIEADRKLREYLIETGRLKAST